MAESLTYEKVLNLITESSRKFNENLEKSRIEFDKKLDKGFEKNRKEFEERLEKEEAEREKSRKEFEDEFKKSRKEFDKKIGEISGTLGRFVEGLVEPKLLELFRNRGIEVTEIYHNVEIHKKGMEEAEIDLLLINSDYSIAVEVKTTLKVSDVDDHIKRLEKLKNNPIRVLKGTTLLGAVAGMRIEEQADKYAYRQGLFVLKQKGEIVEIANDNKFKPKEWK